VIYTGAPGIYQKFTIQEMDQNGRIVSFFKCANTPHAVRRIENEAKVLRFLESKPLTFNYPRLLDTYERGGVRFLQQSDISSAKARFTLEFTQNHRRALYSLNKELRTQTQTALMLDSLRTRIAASIAPDSTKAQLANTISVVEKRLPNADRLDLTFSHGDFNPWNILVSDDGLYVFDWEMGEFRPPLWDYFNFVYHTAFLMGQWDLDAIESTVTSHATWIESLDIHMPYRTLWALYLVDITLHYFEHLSLLGPMARNNVSELAHAFAGACQRLTPVD